MEEIYAPKKQIKKLIADLKNVGLNDKASELSASDISKITYEEEARYDALLLQAIKAADGIVKTEWEKKIVEKIGNPDGTATPDCWFTAAEANAELRKIVIEHDPTSAEADALYKDVLYGFYTYMGEVCVLSDIGYDADFDSFPVEFQKKAWELIEAGSYCEE